LLHSNSHSNKAHQQIYSLAQANHFNPLAQANHWEPEIECAV
jgi:hypothetical protein